MGLPAYFQTSILTIATLTDSGTAASATYPISYLLDSVLGTTARWLSGGAVVEAHLSANYNSLFIGNHNLVTPATFQVQADTVTPPGGGVLTVSPTARTGNMFIDLTFALNRAYLRITPSLVGSQEIGELLVGTRIPFPRNFEWIYPKQQTDLGITQETRAGNQFDYEFGRYKEFRPSWMFPESELETFRTFSDAVGRDPFVWIPDVAATEAYFVKKDRGFKPQPIGPGRESGSLEARYRWQPLFRTMSEGLTVTA